MNLDFSLTFLHGHLELVFSILKTKDFISLLMYSLLKVFNFQLHHIMLDQCLLLLLLDFLEISTGHLILKSQLLDHIVKFVLAVLHFDDDTSDVSAFILQVLVGGAQQVVLGLKAI